MPLARKPDDHRLPPAGTESGPGPDGLWRRVREADPPPARFEDLLLGPPALPPTVRTTYPGWHPRLPLGIWAFRSGVAFRNVTLTPLP